MFRKMKGEKRDKTIEEQQATCFGILDATDEDMKNIIKKYPYVLSKLKEI